MGDSGKAGRPGSPDPQPSSPDARNARSAGEDLNDPLALIDDCLATLEDNDPRQKLLYKLRHAVLQGQVVLQQREAEFAKLNGVVEKLTAPANRIGMLLGLPAEGLARIAVGGAEYFTNLDPRVNQADLKIGTQVLVNEAYAVINTLGYDRTGPALKVAETLADGRLRFEQEPGRNALILERSSDLAGAELKAGDEVRIDPSHRIAIEKLEDREATLHLLDEVPTITWEQIGGQSAAITAIRKTIEYPLLHAETFTKYQFAQPKGFLLHGPPGCGKTLIGRAAAGSLSKMLAATDPNSTAEAAISQGVFLHVKGPEILNMWLGESERMLRDLFAQARARRKEGVLPFIFIDEAESILGTRRAMRSFNISNTLVPMFCAEIDGIESLRDVVIILASNRPDLIDPAVLRPGRIDRKIKVGRPAREEASDILRIYLAPELPLASSLLEAHGHDRSAARDALIKGTVDVIFRRADENRLLSVRLRSGQNKVLYKGDLVSGAILTSIVQRAKERAIERSLRAPEEEQAQQGLTLEDMLTSVHAEYREGEMLPPDDAAEEWLKLLDHHPEQVVGLSSFRSGRAGQERPIGQII